LSTFVNRSKTIRISAPVDGCQAATWQAPLLLIISGLAAKCCTWRAMTARAGDADGEQTAQRTRALAAFTSCTMPAANAVEKTAGPAAAGVKMRTAEDRGAQPLAVAPHNIFLHDAATCAVSGATRAWTNYYELPVEYTVEMHTHLLDPARSNALATRFMPDGLKRRFCVVDRAVHDLYGESLLRYFMHHGVELKTVVIEGGEEKKKWAAVHEIFDALCDFGLLRREPIIAIGGGCVLDIVGFAASTYRRGVPYVRVPTTLLGIVDASVGVKCGIDWEHPTKGGLKNRMGAFYPCVAAFLDSSFIATQDERNIANGMGEIIKLALVRSPELFCLLEEHGRRVMDSRFQNSVEADRIIELSVQIMLEELGPNLWEYELERCVDYGHTFSKILEMSATPLIMHGEAVNVDGFFCVILAHRRGWIKTALRDRVLAAMRDMRLLTWHSACTLELMSKGVKDGIEHRHGKLRMPLVKNKIGEYGFVQECSREELSGAIAEFNALHVEQCTAAKSSSQ
jgi:3-dehydroquinate synthetase